MWPLVGQQDEKSVSIFWDDSNWFFGGTLFGQGQNKAQMGKTMLHQKQLLARVIPVLSTSMFFVKGDTCWSSEAEEGEYRQRTCPVL